MNFIISFYFFGSGVSIYNMAKTILVTGGAGYIGSHTAVELITRGYTVVIIDNLCNSDKTVIDNIEKITGVRPMFIKADLCDKVAVDTALGDYKFDAVIHFAGLKAVGESVEKPLMYYKNNLLGTINLLESMVSHGVKKIVFSSSATVYGDPKEMPIKETAPIGGTTNPYGTTKYMLERIIGDVCVAHPDMTAVLLRYFNPIGAHKSGLIGDNPRGIPNNLAPYIMQVANGTRPFLNVYGNDYDTPDGTGVRDYIHVVDLAIGHVAAIEKIKKTGTVAINLGTGKGTSVLELLSACEKAVGKKIPYKIVPRRSGDVATSYADVTKAKEVLAWSTRFSIADACESMWNYMLQSHQK